MIGTDLNRNFHAAEGEVDLRELFLTLWRARWIVLGSCVLGAILATYYAFVVLKPVYDSSAILLPMQAPTPDLGMAAAVFGTKTNKSGDVDLYQSLLTSRTVIRKLLSTGISNLSDSGKGRIEPLFKILKLDTSNHAMQNDAIRNLARSIEVGSKESGAGGLLEIKFSASTPWLAQQIGVAVLSIGQDELREIRIERSEVIMTRLNISVEQAKSEWDSSARVLAWYKDRNRSIVLPEQELSLSRLEIEKQGKQQKYLQARGEYDAQVLEIAKAAPPMMILDQANLPSAKSKPNRTMIVALGLLIGGLASAMGCLIWKALKELTKLK